VCHRIDQERNLKLFGHSLERFGLSVTLAHACCVQLMISLDAALRPTRSHRLRVPSKVPNSNI
jgi:hypothetical protein